MPDEILIEALAALSHDQWSGWMKHLFQFGTQNEDGTFMMDADRVERWRRQMDTPYADLSDGEKESDRKEARRMLDTVWNTRLI
jgi:hypothetical protein